MHSLPVFILGFLLLIFVSTSSFAQENTEIKKDTEAKKDTGFGMPVTKSKVFPFITPNPAYFDRDIGERILFKDDIPLTTSKERIIAFCIFWNVHFDDKTKPLEESKVFSDHQIQIYRSVQLFRILDDLVLEAQTENAPQEIKPFLLELFNILESFRIIYVSEKEGNYDGIQDYFPPGFEDMLKILREFKHQGDANPEHSRIFRTPIHRHVDITEETIRFFESLPKETREKLFREYNGDTQKWNKHSVFDYLKVVYIRTQRQKMPRANMKEKPAYLKARPVPGF